MTRLTLVGVLVCGMATGANAQLGTFERYMLVTALDSMARYLYTIGYDTEFAYDWVYGQMCEELEGGDVCVATSGLELTADGVVGPSTGSDDLKRFALMTALDNVYHYLYLSGKANGATHNWVYSDLCGSVWGGDVCTQATR